MSVLDHEEDKSRSEFVNIRFTSRESEALQKLATDRSISRAEMIRNLALAELEADKKPSPELVEIVGLRLLLVNLVKPLYTAGEVPLESVDKISGSAKAMKKDLAAAILSGEKD
jgi:hypothetical protein